MGWTPASMGKAEPVVDVELVELVELVVVEVVADEPVDAFVPVVNAFQLPL